MDQKLPYSTENFPMYPQAASQGFNASAPQYGHQQPLPSFGNMNQNQNFQQGQFHQPQQFQQPVQIQPQQAIQANPMVGPQSTSMTCPSCNKQINSMVVHKASSKTHIVAGILCVIGCWPCCLFPYCMNSCKNLNHSCPACRAYLGTYSN